MARGRPIGRHNLPGHAKVMRAEMAACECGWPELEDGPSQSLSESLRRRTLHLTDIRMFLIDKI